VERPGLDAVRSELLQPPAQLTGRPGGEGDRQHAGRVVGTDRHPVCDAVRDGASLSGASACDDRHRATQRRGNLPLLRIEAGQQLLRTGHHTSDGHARHPKPSR
jgi:hypothetical protein